MLTHHQAQTPQSKFNQQKKINLDNVVQSLFCQEHSDYYTNFCCSFECLKPLCPDCVSTHSKAHHKQNSLPQIESFKQVKNICSMKIVQLITHLKEQIDECEFRSIFDPKKMLDEAQKELNVQQEKIINFIKNYFDEQREIYRLKLNENSLKSNEFKSVFEKFKKILEELEYLQERIQYEQSENFVRHIKQAILLDQEKLLKTSSADIYKLLQKQQINQLDIAVDDSGLNNLRRSLNQICAVQVQQIQPHLNATQHSQSSQKFIQLGSNQLGIDDNNIINQSNQEILPFKKPISQIHTPIVQNKYNLHLESPQQQQLYQISQINNMSKKANNSQFFDQQKAVQEFIIQQKDYFNDQTKLKFLHFFQSGGKSLFLLDLNQSLKFVSFNQTQKLQFQEIKLNINFDIPKFHRSIITPNGDIYLTGGQYLDFSKSAYIFKYIYQDQSLLPMDQNMLVARSSHAICYFEPFIVICGGMTKNQKTLSHCEKFNTLTGEVTTMANLNNPCSSFCITSFKNKYIFKFGGLSEGQQQKQILNQIIEKYDFQLNKWEVIDPQIKINKVNKNIIQKFKLNSEAGAIQINENNIFVFGGYNAEGPTNQSFLLNTQNQKYCIINISEKDLPYSEGIWNNQTMILGGQVYALQNVANQSNEFVLDDQKKVNCFDSTNWLVLN